MPRGKKGKSQAYANGARKQTIVGIRKSGTNTARKRTTTSKQDDLNPKPIQHQLKEEEGLAKELAELRAELEKERSDSKDLRNELEKRDEEIKKLQIDHDEEERYCHGLMLQLNSLRAEYKVAKLQHQQRAQELHAAHKYLRQDSSYSVKEIISMVDNLNAEIYHAAVSISLLDYGVEQELKGTYDVEGGSAQVYEDVVWFLGEGMGELLREPKVTPYATALLQSALQAVMVLQCCDMVQLWSPSLEESEMLRDIYEGVKENGTSTIASRWRALTRARSKYTLESYSALTTGIQSSLLKWIRKVLHLAGRPYDHSQLEGHIGRVLKSASRLDRILGEHVAEQTWDVFCVDRDDIFTDETMEDVSQTPSTMSKKRDQVPPNERTILCTTDLGLQAKGAGQVMRKAKVLLRGTMVSTD
ncbi:hypothetical protein Moror_12442 [Moniliophthora roreri MCA 2997]|uniref:Uncharacterized protein n=2 Tax=Moniliophthora roreri TaxID=221103 RepID=V2XTG6_MONRO|nr:hypothetical protein Moror_12442 [Moniliophthora roreri MCA 2997]KAI3616218.1 hypothetical protein WG66_014013 [Moniliophthora roreri]